MNTNKERKSTVVGKLDIIDNFLMPQFNDGRSRTIRVWMPESYDKDSSKTYPVIYMHDGQNLFDNKTSYLVEWEVDETITRLINEGVIEGAIVVGIDNSVRRINEYLGYNTTYEDIFYDAEGDTYGRFIVETLKPFIDSRYRTKASKEHTFISGSSMGGVISFYLGLKYPEVFSKIGAFSTAFELFPKQQRELFYNIVNFNNLTETKLYLDISTREPGWDEINVVKSELLNKGFNKDSLHILINSCHNHDEIAWRERLPFGLMWLFGIKK